MTATEFIRIVPGGWSRRRLPTLLLVLALLLCHGAYGALHQIHHNPSTAPLVVEHASPANMHGGTGDGGHPDEGEVCHLGSMPYAALLLAPSLSASLWLVANRVRPWIRLVAALLLVWNFSVLAVHPARGPTLPIIQVFRL